MLNFLVETKNEYTTHLSNILTPLIFEGLQSIYKESLEIAGATDILKIFQSFLKRIPRWNQTIIDTETERIINSSHSYGWLNELIRATLKANLVVLMYNPTCTKQTKINPKYYQDIKTCDFIHKVYIECARELYNNPYLMYHEYPPIEIKRNQRDCLYLIKECIKEALRKLLPVKHILEVYLGEEMELNKIDDDQFDKAISEVEERNLTKLIKKDLSNNDDNDPSSKQTYTIEQKQTEPAVPPTVGEMTPRESSLDTKTIGSRILGIINEDKDNTLDMTSLVSSTSDLIPTQQNEPIQIQADSVQTKETFDDKVKKILQKDLATDSDLETSLDYGQEDNNNKYHEIFSNSGVSPKKEDLANLKDKKKFFNNYLQF